MSRLAKFGIGAGILLLLSFILLMIIHPWKFVDNYQIGYVFNAKDGSIKVLPHPGYYSRTPFIESIHTVDKRPRQVCINVGAPTTAGSGGGANSRVLNCKLVQFNPAGLPLFLSWHGRDDYEGQTLDDLLKIYAYDGSGRTYPFLTILRELRNDDAVAGQPVVGQ